MGGRNPHLAWPAVILFAIIFLWTPPHFWALSLLIKRDYERANIPMLPIVRGDAETQKQIFCIRSFCSPFRFTSYWSHRRLAISRAALALGIPLLGLAARLWRDRPSTPAAAHIANQLFWYSNSYLALLFVAVALDRVVR